MTFRLICAIISRKRLYPSSLYSISGSFWPYPRKPTACEQSPMCHWPAKRPQPKLTVAEPKRTDLKRVRSNSFSGLLRRRSTTTVWKLAARIKDSRPMSPSKTNEVAKSASTRNAPQRWESKPIDPISTKAVLQATHDNSITVLSVTGPLPRSFYSYPLPSLPPQYFVARSPRPILLV